MIMCGRAEKTEGARGVGVCSSLAPLGGVSEREEQGNLKRRQRSPSTQRQGLESAGERRREGGHGSGENRV